MTLHDSRLPPRFWAKIRVQGDCWIWTGAASGPTDAGRTRYGYINIGGKAKRAHRVAYEALVGSVPEDKPQLDHVKTRGCLGTLCVNPAHLEPVTNRENCLRGNSPRAKQARKTHCAHGHPYDAGNTTILKGKRYCRECARLKARAVYRAKRTERERLRAEGVIPTPTGKPRQSHCKRGHPLTGENVYQNPRTGDRHCKTCRRQKGN